MRRSAFERLVLARRDTRSGKSRVFSVRFCGYLAADGLWEPGAKSTATKPIWLAYLGTEAESRAFSANFRAGTKAQCGSRLALVLPKRSEHRFVTQAVPFGQEEAVMTVAYLPSLFHLEPPSPVEAGEGVSFVFAPPRWWLDAQAEALAEDFGDEAGEVAEAALFVAYLDRRTPLPLVHDLRFHLQLYRAAREAWWVYPAEVSSSGYGRRVIHGQGFARLGLGTVLACSATASTIEAFVREQTAIYHQEEIRRGTSRIAAARRLLPHPSGAPAQLCLDFAVA